MIAAPCAAFVLAGGRSSRMGADKALVELAGEPLIVHTLRTLRTAGLDPVIAGARSELASFAPVLRDTGRGPLDGICTALASTSGSRAVFLSVDQPFVPPALIQILVEDAELTNSAVAVARSAGFTETFPAVLDRTTLPVLQAALTSGHGGCFRAFQQVAETLGRPFRVLPLEVLAQTGRVAHAQGIPASFWCASVNTPGDLARANCLISRSIA